MPALNLFTIGPHRPFLTQLAQSWLNGQLGISAGADPLVRVDTTFYLPTRRAARSFADILTAELGGKALLPTIRTLADSDDDEALDSEPLDPDQHPSDGHTPEPLDIATMPPLRRRLILTRLIEAAGNAMRQAQRGADIGVLADDTGMATPIFPQSASEAVYLAKILGDLIDQVATEECNWSALKSLVPQDYAAYWQLTLTLLTLVTDHWPAILQDEGAVDAATYRRMVLDARTARILAGEHQGPIIAAGSTGSIPATARLLKAIAHADQGAVVLPGLDLWLDDQTFQRLGEDKPDTASHPQHGLARLLGGMQATRADVVELGGELPDRQRLVSAALLPVDDTGKWTSIRPLATTSFDTVTLLEASNEGEEALAIAMTMKASVAKGQSIALVTPDRSLARRVQLDVERFDLHIDNSAGTPLSETPPARLLVLAAQAFQSGFAAIPLLALLKHPLTAFGQDPAKTRAQARLLERLALRGLAMAPGLEPVRQRIREQAEARTDPTIRQPKIRAQLTETDDGQVQSLLDRLENAFQPLTDLAEGPYALSAYLDALFATCERLAETADPDLPNALYAGAPGESLAGLRVGLREATGPDASADLDLDPAQAGSVFEALLADHVVRPKRQHDPRVHIWGPLEARLQTVDHIILAGLNETTWPALPSASPLLSRGMMAGMALEVPERRIGLSAHDIEQALGHKHVTLSRAKKVDGAPTVRSRWLQRLFAFLPDATGEAMCHRGDTILAVAHHWDSPDRTEARKCPEPRPAKPPTQISVTEVETLIRDPYTVYARKVLRLEEAPGLGLPPGPAERGTLFHALFEVMSNDLNKLPQTEWPNAFQAHSDTLLQILAPFPDIQALWSERINRLKSDYLKAEAEWSEGLESRLAEVSGALPLEVAGQKCRLTGRADRVDLYSDGSAAVLDFKTGSIPSAKQIKTFSPQLPLLSAMVAAGAFADSPQVPVHRAQYVLATGKSKPFEVSGLSDRQEIAEAAEDALTQLTSLWATYLAGAPFLPLVRAERAQDQGPFHQLARVKEWSIADETQGDER